jgi:glycosyltransferase involved in cell wall biosynthesis
VPPGDPAALAAALACLADSAPLRGELGRAAHERCGRLFAMPRVAEAYRGLYASLVPAA